MSLTSLSRNMARTTTSTIATTATTPDLTTLTKMCQIGAQKTSFLEISTNRRANTTIIKRIWSKTRKKSIADI